MRTKRRLLSLLLCGALLFSLCSPSAFAEAQTIQDSGQITVNAGGLCEHHTGHTPDCGYTEGEPETPCTHQHTDECYIEVTECVHGHNGDCYPEETENSVSGNNATTSNVEGREPKNCDHVCNVESGCITKELDCKHEHNEDCGYSPAVEGTPCGYICKVCKASDSLLEGSSEENSSIGTRDTEKGNPELQKPVNMDDELELQTVPDLEKSSAAAATLIIGNVSTMETNPDLLGDGGSASYDADTHTLTLNDCRLPDGKIIFTDYQDKTLTIELNGKNVIPYINVSSGGLSLRITGNGSLEMENKDSYAIISNHGDIEITGGATITAISSTDCGIFALGSIKISNSTVTAKGKEEGLRGDAGIAIKDGSDVTAVSSNGCAIFSRAGITISASKVNAEGYGSGLRGNGGVSIEDGSKVTTTATAPSDREPCGICSENDFLINDSELYIESEHLGIYTRNKGTISGAWLQANSGVWAENKDQYTIADSVIIESGKGQVNGDARLFQGADLRLGDEIDIPLGASLTVEAGGIKILGGSGGITVGGNGELLLPPGTVLQKTDGAEGMEQIIGNGGGSISPDGRVEDWSSYKLILSVPAFEDAEYGYTPKAEAITITNTGDSNATISDITISGSAFTINPGDKLVYTDRPNNTWTIQPKAGLNAGKYTGTLTVTYNGNATVTAEVKLTVNPLPAKYTVIVQTEGNGTASASPTSAAQGTEITLTATPDKDWHFKDWQVVSGSVIISGDKFTMPAESVTVKAIFEKDSDPTPPQPTKYTVTVRTEGNGTASASPTSVAQGTEITLTATPDKDWHFKDWQVVSGSVIISGDKFTMPAESVTVKAIFEKDGGTTPPQPTEYTVTFDGNGGTSPAAQTTTGRKLTSLPTSTQSGYSFNGWYTTKTGGNEITLDTVFTASVTVYAQWTKNSSSGGSSGNGGNSGGGGSSTPTYGSNTLSNSGITLSGSGIHKDARLTVTPNKLHDGQCAECDQIRQWQEQGRVIAIYDVSLSYGFRGTVTLTFPVSSAYNGKTLTVAHCLKDKLDTCDVTVSNEKVMVTADGLSPFAILDNSKDEPGKDNPNTGAENPGTGTENPGTGTGKPFTDVKETDWFYKSVMFVYENGLMAGTSATTFDPNSNATRAQLAVIFYRMEGSPKVEGKNSFTDVEYGPGTAWYYDAVTWAEQSGVVGGYGDGRFGPGDPVTREQLAAIFYRYAQYKGYDVTAAGNLDRFTDKDKVSEWAKQPLIWAVSSGIVNGTGDNLLSPQGTATRAQLAAMLHRFIDKYGLKPVATSTGTIWTNQTDKKSPLTGDNSTAGAESTGNAAEMADVSYSQKLTADVASPLTGRNGGISPWEITGLCALPAALLMGTAAVIIKRRRKMKAGTPA